MSPTSPVMTAPKTPPPKSLPEAPPEAPPEAEADNVPADPRLRYRDATSPIPLSTCSSSSTDGAESMDQADHTFETFHPSTSLPEEKSSSSPTQTKRSLESPIPVNRWPKRARWGSVHSNTSAADRVVPPSFASSTSSTSYPSYLSVPADGTNRTQLAHRSSHSDQVATQIKNLENFLHDQMVRLPPSTFPHLVPTANLHAWKQNKTMAQLHPMLQRELDAHGCNSTESQTVHQVMLELCGRLNLHSLIPARTQIDHVTSARYTPPECMGSSDRWPSRTQLAYPLLTTSLFGVKEPLIILYRSKNGNRQRRYIVQRDAFVAWVKNPQVEEIQADFYRTVAGYLRQRAQQVRSETG